MKRFSIKHLLVGTLIILPGIVVLLLLFSAVWNYIVKTHVQQFGEETIASQAALETTQRALIEKAAFQAAEYRTKRSYQEAQNQYQLEKIRLKIEMLPRYTSLKFYSAIGVLTVLGISLIILSSGYAGAKIKKASVCIARVGEHSEIPVHYKDLQHFYPIAVNLSLAEIQASTSTSHEQAYQISRQMIEDITSYTRAIAGKRGLLAPGSPSSNEGRVLPAGATRSPTFAELLRTDIMASDTPLILGYDRQGQAQSCSLKDLKSVAIAGWQGSGKTFSMAYIVASIVLAYRTQVYIIDPHHNHPESLYSLIQPLENTGYVSTVNPFHTPALLRDLNKTLDRRLSGQESCTSGILLVIDELAQLTKNMGCFDVLLAFLERCTEETRKANITFIGSSHKWTARHFNGRADIRGCMNSMLIHKTKPSQADLLLEDTANKHLVKQLDHPGEAILAMDYGIPTLVSMPLCTCEDMQTVAEMLRTDTEEQTPFASQTGKYRDGRAPLFETKSSERLKMVSQA